MSSIDWRLGGRLLWRLTTGRNNRPGSSTSITGRSGGPDSFTDTNLEVPCHKGINLVIPRNGITTAGTINGVQPGHGLGFQLGDDLGLLGDQVGFYTINVLDNVMKTILRRKQVLKIRLGLVATKTKLILFLDKSTLNAAVLRCGILKARMNFFLLRLKAAP